MFLARLAAVSVLVSVLVSVVSAHDWAFGKCPKITAFPNLDLDRFLGDWYVMEQFDTASTCLKMEYTKLSETQLMVTKRRHITSLDPIGLKHNSYSGTLDVPHEDDQGRLRIKWPLNIAGKSDYIIFDTDYDNYAGIYDCQPVTGLFHRKSAAILSRTPTLAGNFRAKAKSILTAYGVPVRHFDRVKHEDCLPREETEINVHLDSDTIPTLVDNARDGIEGVATTIIDGIRDIAGSVADQFPSSGNPNSKTPSINPSSNTPSINPTSNTPSVNPTSNTPSVTPTSNTPSINPSNIIPNNTPLDTSTSNDNPTISNGGNTFDSLPDDGLRSTGNEARNTPINVNEEQPSENAPAVPIKPEILPASPSNIPSIQPTKPEFTIETNTPPKDIVFPEAPDFNDNNPSKPAGETPSTNIPENNPPNIPSSPTNPTGASIPSAPDFINNVPDDSLNNNPDDSINNNPDDSINNNPDDSINNIPDDSINNIPDDSINNIPDDSINNIPDDSINNIPDDSINNIPDDSINNIPDDSLNNVPEISINNIDSQDDNLDDSFYNINIEPVDDIVRTVVDIGI